jgi:hypothetical protein
MDNFSTIETHPADDLPAMLPSKKFISIRFRWTPILVVCLLLMAAPKIHAIHITLDFTLDDNNLNWFGNSAAGMSRRAILESAASFLSGIITNDDWNALPTFEGDLDFTDISASTITDLGGNIVSGTPESDGAGYSYSMNTVNRTSVAANEYVIYVGALAFDNGTTAHAKANYDGNDRRNAAGLTQAEFNTWGGQIYFDVTNNWFYGLNPGVDPSDNYGVQDSNKSPTTDITTDNWDWNTTSDSWKGFQLSTLDTSANGRTDLYGTALHEMIHALGMTSGNMSTYVGVNSNGNFIGENVVSVFGGPVPGDGGHFDNDVQSLVWNSQDIISEVLLDPNSTSGVRKYLTKVDAALLRDLGYQVLEAFSPADFNYDGLVDATDLNIWQSSYGIDLLGDADKDGDTDGRDFLIWQRETTSSSPLVANSLAVPEPKSVVFLMSGIIFCGRRRQSPLRLFV